MLFTPFAFIKTASVAGPVIPTSGLVAWYDASDYTSGATWTDRSGNGYNLGLNNSFSKVTSPITAVFFNGGYGNIALVTNWASTTDITHIEILRPTVVSNFIGTFVVQGTNAVGSFQLDGTGRIYTWKNGATGWYLTTQFYNTAKTAFIARRFSSGYNNTGDSLVVNYADSAGVSLTKYGSSNFALGRSGVTTYTIGGSSSLGVGTIDVGAGLTYDMPGYYGVNLFYNRKLTDQEVTDVYNYYKSAYSLS
jgi:hypothetical protein